MEKKGLSLKVSHFRAVENAEIDLESITVLAGVNACGKSTLAHIYHSLVNLNAKYQRSLIDFAWRKVSFPVGAVCELRWQIEHPGEVQSALGSYQSRARYDQQLHDRPFEQVLAEADAFQKETLALCLKLKGNEAVDRAYTAFLRTLGLESGADQFISKLIQETRAFYLKALVERDYGAFLSGDAMSRDRLLEEGDFSFLEDGSVVYATRYDTAQKTAVIASPLKMLYGVARAIYIESPWKSLPNVNGDGTLDFHDGFSALPCNAEFRVDQTLFEVLAGQVAAERQSDASTAARIFGVSDVFRWKYERSDGRTFDLSECATGIKALSILNVLYTRGLLDSKTLLIIDEPEAHLHPQWIVEYARILVLIAKRLKVRLLIASHSPDMVGALRTVSVAEKLDGVRFYLADNASADDRFKFAYRNLGLDVGPIFKAFNKVIDWMDTYAPTDLSASR